MPVIVGRIIGTVNSSKKSPRNSSDSPEFKQKYAAIRTRAEWRRTTREVSRDERFLRGVNKASAAHSHSLSLGWKLLWAALMAG